MKRQELFLRLSLTEPGSATVECEAVVVSRQNGRNVRVKGRFSVVGSIGVRGFDGTTVLILRSERGKDYLINWRYSKISNFKVLSELPCAATLRKHKSADVVWDTLSVRGSADTVRAVRERTISNGGKLF